MEQDTLRAVEEEVALSGITGFLKVRFEIRDLRGARPRGTWTDSGWTSVLGRRLRENETVKIQALTNAPVLVLCRTIVTTLRNVTRWTTISTSHINLSMSIIPRIAYIISRQSSFNCTLIPWWTGGQVFIVALINWGVAHMEKRWRSVKVRRHEIVIISLPIPRTTAPFDSPSHPLPLGSKFNYF